MKNCICFAPQINNSSTILILGSMPGIKSLEKQEYYAHKQNRFWKILGKFCKYDFSNSDYQTKIKILLQNNFALWDVLQNCTRQGSLDSEIKNGIPNNLTKLLEKYKNIHKICLNGNTAYRYFQKNFPDLNLKYKIYKLPSTSPANAKYSFDILYKLWEQVFLE